MKTAYVDCIFGASGDMMLGALTACGMPLEKLKSELAKLNVDGFDLVEEKVVDHGIAATHIEVVTEEQHAHRHLSHINEIITKSDLSGRVKENALKIFKRLAGAEAKVHGTTPEKIHFHEVGALDAIVDVVGTCIALDYLDVDTVVATPLHLGTGTVKCAHGLMPVPVPAVVELTTGVPTVRTGIEGELTTPTGAAILTTLVSSYGDIDGFTPEVSGYGAGNARRDAAPNVLRISIGTAAGSQVEDRPMFIETNIDDMNPEVFGYVSDRLFEAGARDVYFCPVYMKKGRPGTLIGVLADDADVDAVTDILLTETTTIGVRMNRVTRRKLHREERTVETRFGTVKVKVVFVNDGERITPEYEDCARIAREKGVPLLEVYDAARNEGSA